MAPKIREIYAFGDRLTFLYFTLPYLTYFHENLHIPYRSPIWTYNGSTDGVWLKEDLYGGGIIVKSL